MAHENTVKPTDAELDILKILWKHGPATVRQVHEAFRPKRRTGYTTTLKQLQIMTEKGLVKRDEKERSHVYAARSDEGRTLRRVTEDLLDRVFDGSAQKLVMHALSAKHASREELAQIRSLLDKCEGDKNHERD
ncbi:MAG: BlaI/MecI/CopY family transcriptional regulator [Candidatus Sumerlaeia bacterium]